MGYAHAKHCVPGGGPFDGSGSAMPVSATATSAQPLLLQCEFRHLTRDGFARQPVRLHGGLLDAEEARLARRRVRDDTYFEAHPASRPFSQARCDLPAGTIRPSRA
jgi:hypothetical protein